MELNKRKFAKKEVEILLDKNSAYYEDKLFEQKTRISDLAEENKKLSAELDNLKAKQSQIENALIKAEKQALNTIEKANIQYSLTVEKLKNFYSRWNGYFTELKNKYPMYPAVTESAELVENLKSLFKTKNPQRAVEKLYSKFSKRQGNNTQIFDPKSKINDYIAATSDSGFNLDEVLNPGKLELEDLCKELGLIEE